MCPPVIENPAAELFFDLPISPDLIIINPGKYAEYGSQQTFFNYSLNFQEIRVQASILKNG